MTRLVIVTPSRLLLPRLCSAQADTSNHLVRAIAVSTGAVRTLAGQQGISAPFSDGVGSAATFNFPHGVALDSTGVLALVVSGCGMHLCGSSSCQVCRPAL
jgi:hypothetical protein